MTHPTPSSELQDKLVEILTSIQSATSKASDFALGQLPDIAQSYIAYGRASATVVFVLWLAFVVAATYVGIKYGLLSKKLDRDGDWPFDRFLCATGGFASAVFGGVACVSSLGGLLLVWMAPKVWLLKELATFIH